MFPDGRQYPTRLLPYPKPSKDSGRAYLLCLVGWGLRVTPAEDRPRAIAFVDGQNLYHRARIAFGSRHPDYNAKSLATTICAQKGWKLSQVRFYTGIPAIERDRRWYMYWTRKLAEMGQDPKIYIYTRKLQYVTEWVEKEGVIQKRIVGIEKGIDLRIAIDALRLAIRKEYDVAIFISEDSDLSEVVNELKEIGREQRRWITVCSAFPQARGEYRRGIPRAIRFPIDIDTYRKCWDRDYYHPGDEIPADMLPRHK